MTTVLYSDRCDRAPCKCDLRGICFADPIPADTGRV